MSSRLCHHRIVVIAFAALLAAAFAACAVAADKEPLPRFMSLRVDAVNLRAGPGDRYPIEWVFQRKGLPVEITAEFDVWRKIRDSDGTEGWVHQRMVTGARSIVVKGATRMLRETPDQNAPALARVEPGVVAKLLECSATWCRVEAQGTRGWLQHSEIWGVFPNEVVP